LDFGVLKISTIISTVHYITYTDDALKTCI